MSDPNIPIVVVVNGVEVTIEANLNAPIRTVAQHALNDTGNTGRPLSDWELKDPSGNPIPLDRKVGELGLPPNAVLFLTLMVGVNGHALTAGSLCG
jgi:hypothetical protein